MKISSHRFRRSGFTLVELLVGSTLSAAILLAVLSSYLYLGRNLARLVNQQTLETEARRALGFFSRDVQKASGLTDTANLSASRVSLLVPTSAGTTNTITYLYNSNLANNVTVTVNGTDVIMPPASFTRCTYDGTTVSSLTLLRNITDGDSDTSDNDLRFRYYSASDTEYTSYSDYLPGIKQVSLEFCTQTGVALNGTLTPLHRVATGRLVLRNRPFLQ